MARNSAFDNFYKDQLNEILQSTGNVWEEAIKFKSNDIAQKMQNLYGDIIDLQQDFECYLAARSGYNEEDTYEGVVQAAQNLKQQNARIYQRQKEQQIEQQKERMRGGDDDIIIEDTPSAAGLICPFTDKIPTHPMVSRRCHHVYEKDPIIAYVRGNRGTVPCPKAGCSRNITIDDLYEDPEITRRCDEARAQQKNDDDYEAIH